jgi:50S ribosomal protein L16 3-hydroxylase
MDVTEPVIVGASWDELVESLWPHRPCVLRSVPSEIFDVSTIDQLVSIKNKVPQQKAICKVWSIDRNGNHVQKRSGASSSGSYLEAGCSVMWDNIDNSVDRELRNAIIESLGYTFRSTSSNFLQTPAGGIVATHFDCMEVFVLQVSGSKRWHISQNLDIHCPTFGYLDRFGMEVMQREAFHWPLRKPGACEMQTFLLEPGNIVFLPRGCWHSTMALEDSLSITMSFITRTSLDIGLVDSSSLQARCVPSRNGEGCPLCKQGLH